MQPTAPCRRLSRKSVFCHIVKRDRNVDNKFAPQIAIHYIFSSNFERRGRGLRVNLREKTLTIIFMANPSPKFTASLSRTLACIIFTQNQFHVALVKNSLWAFYWHSLFLFIKLILIFWWRTWKHFLWILKCKLMSWITLSDK